MQAWRKTLELAKKPKQASALADPAEQPEEFLEGWELALQREQDVLNGATLEEVDGEDETYEEARMEDAPSFQLNGLSIHDQAAPLVDFGAEDLRKSLFSLPFSYYD